MKFDYKKETLDKIKKLSKNINYKLMHPNGSRIKDNVSEFKIEDNSNIHIEDGEIVIDLDNDPIM